MAELLTRLPSIMSDDKASSDNVDVSYDEKNGNFPPDEKTPRQGSQDLRPDELADAARRQSVALNIVENPLRVSFATLSSSRD